MSLFISEAYAAGEVVAPAGPTGQSTLIMMVAMAVIFYFMLWRPQSKRSKEQKTLLESLSKGAEVVTTGGILGKITKVTDEYIVLDIANNLEIKMQKSSVHAALPKGTIKNI